MINIQSDSEILNASTIERDHKTGVKFISTQVDQGAPIIKLQFDREKLGATEATAWCNYVRSVVNEWQKSKETEGASSESVPPSDTGGGSTNAGEQGGVGEAAAKPVQEDEETVHEEPRVLEFLKKRESVLAHRMEVEANQIAILQERATRQQEELVKLRKAIKAFE